MGQREGVQLVPDGLPAIAQSLLWPTALGSRMLGSSSETAVTCFSWSKMHKKEPQDADVCLHPTDRKGSALQLTGTTGKDGVRVCRGTSLFQGQPSYTIPSKAPVPRCCTVCRSVGTRCCSFWHLCSGLVEKQNCFHRPRSFRSVYECNTYVAALGS